MNKVVKSHTLAPKIDKRFKHPQKIARQYFPNASDDELEGIIWGETGYPSFWRIGTDGDTPMECFRSCLLRAVARREIKYNNIEIIEEDPYVGEVSELHIKQNDHYMGELKIVFPNDAVVHMDRKGKCTLKRGKKKTKIYEPPDRLPFNKYVATSDIVEEFINRLAPTGITQEQFMKIPMEVFLNFLILKAAEKDGDPVPEGVFVEDHPAIKKNS